MESFKFELDVISECLDGELVSDDIATRDDDFYEHFDAPMYVDLAAPDVDPNADDASWFCGRTGCDRKHELVIGEDDCGGGFCNVVEFYDGGDDDDDHFYEHFDAPKYVDLTAQHPDPPADDAYWFCSRLGCDRKHEQDDCNALYRSFIPKKNSKNRAIYGLRAPPRKPNAEAADEKKAAWATLGRPKQEPSHSVKHQKQPVLASRKETTTVDNIAGPKLKIHDVGSFRLPIRQSKNKLESASAKKRVALLQPQSRQNQEPLLCVQRHQNEPVAVAGKTTVAKQLFMNAPKGASETIASSAPLKGQMPVIPEACPNLPSQNKAQKTTKPKPFRLRTEERAIMKERNRILIGVSAN